MKTKKNEKKSDKDKFSAIEPDTKGFKFNRDETHER